MKWSGKEGAEEDGTGRQYERVDVAQRSQQWQFIQ